MLQNYVNFLRLYKKNKKDSTWAVELFGSKGAFKLSGKVSESYRKSFRKNVQKYANFFELFVKVPGNFTNVPGKRYF